MEEIRNLGGGFTIQLFENEQALLIRCTRKVSKEWEEPQFQDFNFVVPKRIPRKRDTSMLERFEMIPKHIMRMISKLSFEQIHQLRKSSCYHLYPLNVKREIYSRWAAGYLALPARKRGAIMQEIEERLMS